METSSELSSSTQHEKVTLVDTNHLQPSSLDSSLLRFPTPATDERVSTWVERTAAASMSARSDDGCTLGDSSYDFVEELDTDREDNTTESIASTDFGRPDDVASLADTEASGSESDDEEHSEQAVSQRFPDFEQAVQQAFDTPTLGRSSTVMNQDEDRRLSQSIEFEETLSLGMGNVSVRHTVTEFSEEETARLTQSGAYQGSPKRLVVTIRQTMTPKRCLSTKEPLRILYVLAQLQLPPEVTGDQGNPASGALSFIMLFRFLILALSEHQKLSLCIPQNIKSRLRIVCMYAN
jgi:hypothetical protein